MNPYCHSLGDAQLHHPTLARIAARWEAGCNLKYARFVLKEAPDSVGAHMPIFAKSGGGEMFVGRDGLAAGMPVTRARSWVS